MNNAVLVPVTENNLSAFLDLGEELMGLSSYKQAFDRKWAAQVARDCITNPRYFARLALLPTGKPCGLVVGSVSQMLFSPQIMAVEETIYVREGTPFRAAVAKQLLWALTKWAFVSKEAAFIRAGETSGIRPAAVDAFFKHCGFHKSGTLYCKDLI